MNYFEKIQLDMYADAIHKEAELLANLAIHVPERSVTGYMRDAIARVKVADEILMEARQLATNKMLAELQEKQIQPSVINIRQE